ALLRVRDYSQELTRHPEGLDGPPILALRIWEKGPQSQEPFSITRPLMCGFALWFKCVGYDSRKVESANATMNGGWGQDFKLGRRRIHYEAAHLCAQESHL